MGKALTRRQNDSDGALTAAKTLLESVCKHILMECKVPYSQYPEIRIYPENLFIKAKRNEPGQHISPVLGFINFSLPVKIVKITFLSKLNQISVVAVGISLLSTPVLPSI
jgi:hypothetical protein